MTVPATIDGDQVAHAGAIIEAQEHPLPAAQCWLPHQVVLAIHEPRPLTERTRGSLQDSLDVGSLEEACLAHQSHLMEHHLEN